jgi:hypothetical protein
VRLPPLVLVTVGLLTLPAMALAGPFGIPLPIPIPGVTTPAADDKAEPAAGEQLTAYALVPDAIWCADKKALAAGTCADGIKFLKGESLKVYGQAGKDGLWSAQTTREGFKTKGWVKAEQFALLPDKTAYDALWTELETTIPADQRIDNKQVNWLDLLNHREKYEGKKYVKGVGTRESLKYDADTGYVEWTGRIITQEGAPSDKTAPVVFRLKSPELVAAYKNGQIGYSCNGSMGGQPAYCDSQFVVATLSTEVRENVGYGGVVMKLPIFEVETFTDRFGTWKAAK